MSRTSDARQLAVLLSSQTRAPVEVAWNGSTRLNPWRRSFGPALTVCFGRHPTSIMEIHA